MDHKKSGEITLQEIKNILLKHYQVTYGGEMINRELAIVKPQRAECYFLTLVGTPPKGYGIFIPETRVLCLYDAKGKRFKEIYLQKGIVDLF